MILTYELENYGSNSVLELRNACKETKQKILLILIVKMFFLLITFLFSKIAFRIIK